MNATTRTTRTPSSLDLDSLVVAGLVAFAVVQFAIAIFMALAPQAFHSSIGPFGARNDHYLRDLATYNAALGAGLAISVRRVSWRIPVLALTTIQFALHSVNHLIDIGAADPTWVGYLDFFALTAATLQLVWLMRAAARTSQTNPEGAPR
jgi:hypothetical protein